MRRSRIAGSLMAAVLGSAVGAVGTLTAGELVRITQDVPRPAPSGHPSESPAFPVPRFWRAQPGGRVLLVWAPGGLPSRTQTRIEDVDAVAMATTVTARLDWLTKTSSPDGTVMERPSKGRAIPFELAAVEPREYARFVPASERASVLALERGDVLLAETESLLRSGGEGLRLDLGGGPFVVSGVVSDEATGGYEGLISRAAARKWGRADEFVLVKLFRHASRSSVERRLATLFSGRSFRVRTQGETPFLRFGDAVLPQMLIKESFGEYSARPNPDGTLDIDERWRRQEVRTARVPILGRVTCHRALFPQLRAAFSRILAEGIAFTVDAKDYGGCYSPRFVNLAIDGRLSHHSWGIAIDLNVGQNAFGTKPDQNREVVRIFEDAGFTWGGRWLVPDGMHFEWVRFPT